VKEELPRIRVEQSGRARPDEEGKWRFTWRIHNLEKEAIILRAALLPHGKFRSEPRTFEKGLVAGEGASISLEFSVLCQETPGSVVENAFLILQVDWRQSAWRIFTRFRVFFDKAAKPRTKTELITTQKVGSSAD